MSDNQANNQAEGRAEGRADDRGRHAPPGDPVVSRETTAGARETTAAAEPSGVDLARAALAAARAQARRRGQGRRGAAASRRDAAARRSGSGPDERDPQPLGHTIDRLITERGWETPAAVAGVFGRWEIMVGTDVAAHCVPERFADGEVAVRADSTAWATQVRLLAPTIVQRLNAELGPDTVRRIKVLGPSAPTWRRGPLRAHGSVGPRDTYG